MLTIPERVAHLGHVPAAFGGGQHIGKDLEALGLKPLHHLVEALALDHKEPAHWVCGFDAQNFLGQIRCNLGAPSPHRCKPVAD